MSLDRGGRVAVYPCQAPGLPEALGLTPRDCAQAAWAITPDGRRLRGAAAIHAALAWALGQPVILDVYYFPGFRQLADLAYALIAHHRGRLPGVTPYCRHHPEDCAPH